MPDLLHERRAGRTSSAVPLAAGDFACLRDTEKKLNAMIAEQAAANGARYVDTYTPTVGHDMCEPRTADDLTRGPEGNGRHRLVFCGFPHHGAAAG